MSNGRTSSAVAALDLYVPERTFGDTSSTNFVTHATYTSHVPQH